MTLLDSILYVLECLQKDPTLLVSVRRKSTKITVGWLIKLSLTGTYDLTNKLKSRISLIMKSNTFNNQAFELEALLILGEKLNIFE